ncbi:MAG: GTPase Era [Burkholderiaceae bacterium]|jgi:GTP-binding protein Era
MSEGRIARCGLIAVIGRPNVGKSTLMNALIGEHLSITSSKPQTTRHRVTGVLTKQLNDIPTQFVFIDTPGLQKTFTSALNTTMNKSATSTLKDADIILFVLECGKLSAMDRKIAEMVPAGANLIAVVNKLDQLKDKAESLPFLQQVSQLREFTAIVPISAGSGFNLDRLLDVLQPLLPEQPFIFDEDSLTDRPERFLAAERIREKLFRLVGDELPYTSTVVIDKFEQEGALRRIFATILIDRDTHKSIIIGRGGEKLKLISTQARQDLEKLFGGPVYLETWVKVRSGWADDPGQLRSLGYE